MCFIIGKMKWQKILTLCMLFIFYVITKNSFKNTIRVYNGFDSDQDQHLVGPNLGPNCLQRLSELSEDDKSRIFLKK